MIDARRAVTVLAGVIAGLLLVSPVFAGPVDADDDALPAVAAVPAASGLPPDTRTSKATGVFFWANAWAAHHTARTGYWSGAQRMRRMVRIIGRSHATVGSLAELEASQIRAFRTSGSPYRLLVGGRGMTDGVFWDPAVFDLEHAYTFRTYYADGRRVRAPVAVLRDRRSGWRLAVIAIHNPYYGYDWRERALARDLQEVRRLRRQYGGDVRVFVAGDFNAGATVACTVRARARLYSAGYRSCDGRVPIDQLLVDRSVRVRAVRAVYGAPMRSVTDHPAVYHASFSIPR